MTKALPWDLSLLFSWVDADPMVIRQSLQQMLLGKLDICILKTETRPMSFTLNKYQLKMD
jgi:hypothetical protein